MSIFLFGVREIEEGVLWSGAPAREVKCGKSLLFRTEQTGAATPTARPLPIAPTEAQAEEVGMRKWTHSPLVPCKHSMCAARKVSRMVSESF